MCIPTSCMVLLVADSTVPFAVYSATVGMKSAPSPSSASSSSPSLSSCSSLGQLGGASPVDKAACFCCAVLDCSCWRPHKQSSGRPISWMRQVCSDNSTASPAADRSLAGLRAAQGPGTQTRLLCSKLTCDTIQGFCNKTTCWVLSGMECMCNQELAWDFVDGPTLLSMQELPVSTDISFRGGETDVLHTNTGCHKAVRCYWRHNEYLTIACCAGSS